MTVRDISTLEAVYSNMADIPGLPDAYQPRNIAAALKVMRATPYPQFAADECDRLATAHTQLQASLSAANARADQARDAALVEACGERYNEMMSRVAYDLVSVGNRHQRRAHEAKFRKANK